MTLTTEKYTEGLCGDGAAILCEGVPMSVSEILAALNAANREGQPVAWHFPGSETESAQLGYDHELDDEQKQNCIALYAAPPAPAVPGGLKRAVTFYEQVKRENPPVETGAWKDAVNWVLEEACRAAMLGGEK